jgi:HEAT repeat protein
MSMLAVSSYGLRGVLVLACLAVPGLAEQPKGENTEQFLQAHNIAITRQAVTAALVNEDAGVRKSASHVLCRRWPRDAVKPIQAAMLREDNSLVRVSLANDLAQLGDPAGREMLVTECNKSGEWGSTRILAARDMLDLHDDSCVDAVLEILRSPSDPQDTYGKVDALQFVPDVIKHLSGQEHRNAVDMTMNALSDPDAGVRLTASITLGRLGDTSAIAALETAVTGEQDATVQDAMLREVKRLKTLRQGQK